MKKDLKSALGKSLKEETKAIEKRFAQAEKVFSQTKSDTNSLIVEEDSQVLEEVKIEKVIRDSFTLPVQDYQLIDLLKRKALSASISVTKSEIIRAGLLALESMSIEELVKVIKSLTKVKSGRPSPISNKQYK